MEPKMIHDFEQVIPMLRELATAIGGYYLRLIAEGMPPKEAMYLTTELQKAILGGRAVDSD